MKKLIQLLSTICNIHKDIQKATTGNGLNIFNVNLDTLDINKLQTLVTDVNKEFTVIPHEEQWEKGNKVSAARLWIGKVKVRADKTEADIESMFE
tara:strand:+ start:34 stop:318 length:285 start_codon:yes stop_codon:yes gene_type:complete